MSNPTVDQKEAGLMQMKINTRLTALQAAQTLMGTPGYTGVPGAKELTGDPVWVHPPGAVDHITLLAMAGDIEKYIIDDLAQEAKEAIEAAKNKPPHSKILQVRS